MPAAPLPADEAQRLARLRALGVLDTPPEPLYDSLAQLAAAIAGTPIALVSLVDAERQWFKANFGLPGEAQTPRDVAFCAHAVLGDELLEVPDAMLDARFADNPLVQGRDGIRFYAGAPLVMRGGERIGTLCVIDHLPRRLDAAQRAQLKQVAQVVAHALDARARTLELALAMHSRLEAELTGDLRSRHALLDLLPSAVSVWDDALRCVYANATVARWFGHDEPASLRGQPLAAVIGEAAAARARKHHEVALRAGQSRAFEAWVPTALGQRLHRVNFVARQRADGTPEGFIALASDVTAEHAASESEAKFRALSDASPLGVFHTDAAGLCTYTNDRWQQIYGMCADEALGDGWSRHLHPADRDAVFAEWQRAAAAGEEFDMVFRVQRPDASVRQVRARSRELRNAAGALTGHVGKVEDITERLAIEARLRESEAFLERTGRVAGVGGWEVELEPELRVVWSAQTARLHDRPPGHQPSLDEAVGYYVPEARPLIAAAVQRAIDEGTPFDLELPMITAGQRRIWVRAVGEAERRDGRSVRLIGAFQDVTARHEAEDELRQEQALRLQVQRQAVELDALARERSEMLDVLAHEVRQPLNNASAALQSASALMRERGADDAAQRLLRAQNVLGHVLAGVDNTLAVSALLASTQPPAVPDDADLDALLAVVVGDLPAAERSRVRIERESAARTAAMDPGLMRLALRNLIANALKYAPGETPVRVRVADVEEPPALLIDVIDQGPGIDPGVRSRLFQRGAATRRQDGSASHGLGLFIARRALELQRGTVQLLASDDRGTTLRVVLPQGLE